MIVAAGLSPAWQQILRFESFRPGDVNRASQVCWCASGKVINVGVALHHLGGPSRTLFPLGGPHTASIKRDLADQGVPYRSVPTTSATRVCTTIVESDTGRVTELVENAAPIVSADIEQFVRVYEHEAAAADLAVLIGSLPAGTPATFYGDLMDRTPGEVILDFRGPELLAVLDRQPLLIKPNRQELALTARPRPER